ncbi:hypothetical protein LJC48_06480 [Desulfovibrio sp. OttesenSCG-928-C06]|nr:hypothetical protein [Desulfovibrio sp. OttesenSCG-928-C06]
MVDAHKSRPAACSGYPDKIFYRAKKQPLGVFTLKSATAGKGWFAIAFLFSNDCLKVDKAALQSFGDKAGRRAAYGVNRRGCNPEWKTARLISKNHCGGWLNTPPATGNQARVRLRLARLTQQAQQSKNL